MGQVTIYLDEETEKRMRNYVRSSGLSLSKWLANTIKEKTHLEWPDHIRQLAGAWTDLPPAEEVRSSMGIDHKREDL